MKDLGNPNILYRKKREFVRRHSSYTSEMDIVLPRRSLFYFLITVLICMHFCTKEHRTSLRIVSVHAECVLYLFYTNISTTICESV